MKQESQKNTIFLKVLLASDCSKNQIIIINIISVIVASLALWVSAKVQLPFYPVPLTFQTLVVLVIGGIFGWRIGLSALSLYILQGIAGLPVFFFSPEKGIGLVYILGPTGGYLLGFYLAILVMGIFSSKNTYKNYWETFWKSFLVLTVANFTIYIPGIIWLSQFTGWEKVLQFGLYPFIFGDICKIVLASLIVFTILNKQRIK